MHRIIIGLLTILLCVRHGNFTKTADTNGRLSTIHLNVLQMYVCPLCPPERTSHLNLSLTDFLKHVKLLHSHQPGFNITCRINGCIRSFKNFRTFQDHVSAFHRGPGTEDGDNRVVDNREDGDGEVDCDCDEDNEFQSSPEPQSVTAQLQRSSALFLLGLKVKHKLTQVALQGLICRARICLLRLPLGSQSV